jgi:hypothetical protein
MYLEDPNERVQVHCCPRQLHLPPATQPQQQEILYQEILAAVGPTATITKESLGKLHYLRAVMVGFSQEG